MGTLRGLAGRLNERADNLDAAASNLAVKFARGLVTRLIYETPVDKSIALSNWVVKLGARPGAAIPAYYKGGRGSTYSMSAAAAKRAAYSVLQNKKPGQPIFVSNLAKHIVYLNQGTSTQAPAMFVETIILGERAKLRKAMA